MLLPSLVGRLAIVLLLCGAGTFARAQANAIPEFLERYVQFEATDAQTTPDLHAKFTFPSFDALTTRSEVKVNNNGFEDHTVLGFVQRFGIARAKMTYKLHHYSYSTWEDESQDVALELQFHSLHFQHRQQNEDQVTSLGMPVNLFKTHFDLSVSQYHQPETLETFSAYQVASSIQRVKVMARWKNIGTGIWSDFSTEYRPSKSWSMHYSYCNDDTSTQRRFRSVFSDHEYHLAGEYASITDTADQTHVTGAIGIEKDMKLAAVSLRYEYDSTLENSTLFFKLESRNIF